MSSGSLSLRKLTWRYGSKLCNPQREHSWILNFKLHTHSLSHTYTHTYSHTRTHTLTLTHVHTHSLSHTYTHTHSHTRTHTLTLTHVHTLHYPAGYGWLWFPWIKLCELSSFSLLLLSLLFCCCQNIDLHALTGWIPERMSLKDCSDQVYQKIETTMKKGREEEGSRDSPIIVSCLSALRNGFGYRGNGSNVWVPGWEGGVGTDSCLRCTECCPY